MNLKRIERYHPIEEGHRHVQTQIWNFLCGLSHTNPQFFVLRETFEQIMVKKLEQMSVPNNQDTETATYFMYKKSSCIKQSQTLSVWWVKPHGHRSGLFNVVKVSFYTRVIHLLNMFHPNMCWIMQRKRLNVWV